MPNREDMLVRPVLAGLCRYESIHETLLDLRDFADMNDALDIRDENIRRARAAEGTK